MFEKGSLFRACDLFFRYNGIIAQAKIGSKHFLGGKNAHRDSKNAPREWGVFGEN
jgi:hypothetical protein